MPSTSYGPNLKLQAIVSEHLADHHYYCGSIQKKQDKYTHTHIPAHTHTHTHAEALKADTSTMVLWKAPFVSPASVKHSRLHKLPVLIPPACWRDPHICISKGGWIGAHGGGRVSHSVASNSVTPWTIAHQAPLSMRFFRQEYSRERRQNQGQRQCWDPGPHHSHSSQPRASAGSSWTW